MPAAAEPGADLRGVHAAVRAQGYLAARRIGGKLAYRYRYAVAPNLSGERGKIAAIVLGNAGAAQHIERDDGDIDRVIAVGTEGGAHHALQREPRRGLGAEKDLVKQRQIRSGVAKARCGAEGGAVRVCVAETARIGGDGDIQQCSLVFRNAAAEGLDQLQNDLPLL